MTLDSLPSGIQVQVYVLFLPLTHKAEPPPWLEQARLLSRSVKTRLLPSGLGVMLPRSPLALKGGATNPHPHSMENQAKEYYS